jgi:hypothetical protein
MLKNQRLLFLEIHVVVKQTNNEEWFIGNEVLENVDRFTFLGIFLSLQQ